jgi:hypothetical protein
MAEYPADRSARLRPLRAASPTPLSVVPARRIALTSVPSAQTVWAEKVMCLLKAEIDTAVHGGVISAAESEQLLARLGLVIDQALAGR